MGLKPTTPCTLTKTRFTSSHFIRSTPTVVWRWRKVSLKKIWSSVTTITSDVWDNVNQKQTNPKKKKKKPILYAIKKSIITESRIRLKKQRNQEINNYGKSYKSETSAPPCSCIASLSSQSSLHIAKLSRDSRIYTLYANTSDHTY